MIGMIVSAACQIRHKTVTVIGNKHEKRIAQHTYTADFQSPFVFLTQKLVSLLVYDIHA